MNSEYLKIIIDNLGRNGEHAWLDINEHKHDVINARDDNGVSLLAYAIQYNDGGNASYLLSLGADMNAPTKNNGNISCYEYAKEYATYNGRSSYAFDALESFKHINDNLKIEILSDHAFDPISPTKESWYENAKNKRNDEFVSVYHGAKTWNINESVTDSFKELLSTSNCIKEFCGPTLSIQPIGQYWMGLGFEIQIPREQVEFPGEKKENALLKVNETGIAFINNEERSIKFDEYRSKILLNLRTCKVGNAVEAPYPSDYAQKGDYAEKFSIDDKTMTSLNILQNMMQLNYEKVLNKEQNTKKENTMNNIIQIRANILNQSLSENNLKLT